MPQARRLKKEPRGGLKATEGIAESVQKTAPRAKRMRRSLLLARHRITRAAVHSLTVGAYLPRYVFRQLERPSECSLHREADF